MQNASGAGSIPRRRREHMSIIIHLGQFPSRKGTRLARPLLILAISAIAMVMSGCVETSKAIIDKSTGVDDSLIGVWRSKDNTSNLTITRSNNGYYIVSPSDGKPGKIWVFSAGGHRYLSSMESNGTQCECVQYKIVKGAVWANLGDDAELKKLIDKGYIAGTTSPLEADPGSMLAFLKAHSAGPLYPQSTLKLICRKVR
jgi:hypothetical protein